MTITRSSAFAFFLSPGDSGVPLGLQARPTPLQPDLFDLPLPRLALFLEQRLSTVPWTAGVASCSARLLIAVRS